MKDTFWDKLIFGLVIVLGFIGIVLLLVWTIIWMVFILVSCIFNGIWSWISRLLD